MSDAWQGIKVEEFEHVTAGSKALLRLSGRGRRGRAPGHRPVLVIADGLKEHRFSPLPAPPDHNRNLRAAYAVSAGLVRHARSYWLEHDNGKRTNLPVPTAGVGRMTADLVPAEIDADLPDTYEETRRLEQRIRELEEVHARELRDAARRTAEAEQRVVRAEEQAAAAERRERSMADQLARARGETDAATTRAAEAEQTAQSLRTQLAAAQREVFQAAAAREPLERELAELRAANRTLEREFEQARANLRVLTSERDELSRQATAFDEIAVKTRERATRAESEQRKSAELLQELETWRGELERRLAATTTELGVVKAARDAHERELERLRGETAGAGGRVPGLDRAGPDRESSETLAAQAAEIERLAAEVASLRARTGRAD